MERVNCRKCKNYYITWDDRFPHGCKLFSLKGVQMPSYYVYLSSGKPCRFYEERPMKKGQEK